MKNIIHISLTVLLLTLFGCGSFEYSNKTKREQTHMSMLVYEQPISLEDIVEENNPKAVSRGFVSTDILIEGANLAIQGVKMLIDESQKKYHAEYIGGLRNIKFYESNSTVGMLDPDGIKFKGFNFQRTFQDKKSDRELAVLASFSLDESKLEDIYFNSKFYLVVDSLVIDYSKVKVNDSRWYMPWTWFLKKDKTFHLDIEIEVLANWIDEYGQIHSDVPFGKFVLPVHDIPLSASQEDKAAYFAKYKGLPVSGSSYMIPRSSTYCVDGRGRKELCFGRGDFSINTSVRESSKTDFVSQMIIDNKDAIFDNINGKDIINSLEKIKD